MNTIDATPHVSGGDVSPCSVGATCSLNWRSVLIPRNACARDWRYALPRNEAIAVASTKSLQSSGAMSLHATCKQLCVCLRVRFVSDRERDADHPGQIDFAIWLGEQQHAGIEIAILNHGVLRIAGDVQYLQRR